MGFDFGKVGFFGFPFLGDIHEDSRDEAALFRKKIGRDGSPSRQYLAEQLPLSAFLLVLAPDLKTPTQTPFFAIIKPDFRKYENVWSPLFRKPSIIPMKVKPMCSV